MRLEIATKELIMEELEKKEFVKNKIDFEIIAPVDSNFFSITYNEINVNINYTFTQNNRAQKFKMAIVRKGFDRMHPEVHKYIGSFMYGDKSFHLLQFIK